MDTWQVVKTFIATAPPPYMISRLWWKHVGTTAMGQISTEPLKISFWWQLFWEFSFSPYRTWTPNGGDIRKPISQSVSLSQCLCFFVSFSLSVISNSSSSSLASWGLGLQQSITMDPINNPIVIWAIFPEMLGFVFNASLYSQIRRNFTCILLKKRESIHIIIVLFIYQNLGIHSYKKLLNHKNVLNINNMPALLSPLKTRGWGGMSRWLLHSVCKGGDGYQGEWWPQMSQKA